MYDVFEVSTNSFFTWLENAILAPTPISSLLHSSTMVISGVYIGLIMICIIDMLLCVCVVIDKQIIGLLVIGCICVLIKAIIYDDIKSIVAYSTISQISYIFLIMVLFGILVFNHILIHGVFKSMILLICGCLIHGNNNFQSLYMMLYLSMLTKGSLLLGVLVLIGGLSKETIIYMSYSLLSLLWVNIVFVLCGIFTGFYSISILVISGVFSIELLNFFSCFNIGLNYGKMNFRIMDNFSIVWYSLSCIYIDWLVNSWYWLGIMGGYVGGLCSIEGIVWSGVMMGSVGGCSGMELCYMVVLWGSVYVVISIRLMEFSNGMVMFRWLYEWICISMYGMIRYGVWSGVGWICSWSIGILGGMVWMVEGWVVCSIF